MRRHYLLLASILISQTVHFANAQGIKIISKISDPKKAAVFDKNYELVLPCHDYYKVFMLMNSKSVDTSLEDGHDLSYILTNSVYGNTTDSIRVKKTSRGNSILSEIWMTPLNRNLNGYIYLDNNKIITKKYSTPSAKVLTIGNQINNEIDRHCIASQGDSLYYYVTDIFDRKKKLFGKDTMIIDFDFFEWNEKTNKTRFLFSASNIVPDSMLAPELFAPPSDGIYSELDIYHWNWLQKTDTNKLLVNFAFSGFFQIDLNTNHIDWSWGKNGGTFSKVKGIGDLSCPYYTHDLNLITSGPYKGYYSYFEDGYKGDSTRPFKPARGRIFKIDRSDNSIVIVFDKIFDISPVALGSVHVLDNYIMVNLGMILPLKELERIGNSGSANTEDPFKNFKHPYIYIFDLEGNEISHYSYPLGFYSYAAWFKRKSK